MQIAFTVFTRQQERDPTDQGRISPERSVDHQAILDYLSKVSTFVFAHLSVGGDGNSLARLELEKHVPVEVTLPHSSNYRPQCHHLLSPPSQRGFEAFRGVSMHSQLPLRAFLSNHTHFYAFF